MDGALISLRDLRSSSCTFISKATPPELMRRNGTRHYDRDLASPDSGVWSRWRRAGNPASKFEQHFAHCRQLGLRTTIHDGEEGSADDVREALELCKPNRIDHGVAAITPSNLVKHTYVTAHSIDHVSAVRPAPARDSGPALGSQHRPSSGVEATSIQRGQGRAG
jgi:Adenosine deaminase